MSTDHVQGSPPFCRYLVRVMLSAGGAENMRGIERVITGILLAAAICGSAAFARSVGRDAATGAGDVQLTAAPPQHAQSPHGVRVPLYPLLAHPPTVARVAKRESPRPSLAD